MALGNVDNFYLLPEPPPEAAERDSWAVRFAFRAGRLVFRMLRDQSRPFHFARQRRACTEAFCVGMEGVGNADVVERQLEGKVRVGEEKVVAPVVEVEEEGSEVLIEEEEEEGSEVLIEEEEEEEGEER